MRILARLKLLCRGWPLCRLAGQARALRCGLEAANLCDDALAEALLIEAKAEMQIILAMPNGKRRTRVYVGACGLLNRALLLSRRCQPEALMLMGILADLQSDRATALRNYLESAAAARELLSPPVASAFVAALPCWVLAELVTQEAIVHG